MSARAEHLGHGQRVGHEERVARRDVGDRDAGADLGLARPLGTSMSRGQRRAADGAQVEVDAPVRGGAQRGGHARRGLELDLVALAVAEAERVTALALGPGHGQRGGRVEAAREQHDGVTVISTGALADVRADDEAGAREHFEDAALYDFEYRRRRADVNFYRRAGRRRRGPVLDLACGTGGCWCRCCATATRWWAWTARPPCWRAAARVGRLSPAPRAAWAAGAGRSACFSFAAALRIAGRRVSQRAAPVDDAELLAFSRRAARLVPGGWLAFDLLPPDREPGSRTRDSRS